MNAQQPDGIQESPYDEAVSEDIQCMDQPENTYAITPADLDNALSEALQAAKDNLKAPLRISTRPKPSWR